MNQRVAVLRSLYPERYAGPRHGGVCMLSRRFGRELGISGYYISSNNVKLEPVPGGERINLILTDIALHVDRLG